MWLLPEMAVSQLSGILKPKVRKNSYSVFHCYTMENLEDLECYKYNILY